MKTYDYLGMALASRRVLPELRATDAKAAVRFEVRRERLRTGAIRHRWRDELGQTTLCFARVREQDALLFPGVGVFQVEADRIRAFTCADPATVRHCLLDQVLPRFLARRRMVMLHAAAAQIAAGQAALLVGPSGAGKSTLLAEGLRQGARLLSDDCIHLSSSSGRLRCAAPYPSLRLYCDSRQRTGLAAQPTEAFAAGSDKRRIGGFQSCREASVAAIFILADRRGELALRPLRGAEALAALSRHLFAMNPNDLVEMRALFEVLGAHLRTGVPIIELQHPRRFGALPGLWEAVAAQSMP